MELEPRVLQAYKEFEAAGYVDVKKPRFNYIPEIATLVENISLNRTVPIFHKLSYMNLASKFSSYWRANNGPAKYKELPIYLGPGAAMSIINKVMDSGERAVMSEDDEMPVIITPKKK